jgi:hypothetical protein
MKDTAQLQGSNEIWDIFDQNLSNAAVFKRSYAAQGWNTYYAYSPFYNGQGTAGVVLANVVAVDCAQSTAGTGQVYMYIMEDLPSDDTAVVELWRVGNGGAAYQNISFGEGLFYDVKDITVDSNYNVYVLEENSDGSPVIWAFDDHGIMIGSSGPISSDDMSGDPMRMDCAIAKDPDELHVLHTDGVTRFAM